MKPPNYDTVTVNRLRCKKYPAICSAQTGHSGKYCSADKCEHQKKVKEVEYVCRPIKKPIIKNVGASWTKKPATKKPMHAKTWRCAVCANPCTISVTHAVVAPRQCPYWRDDPNFTPIWKAGE